MTGSVNPPIPTLGELNASEDIDIRDSLIDLRDAINDVLTSANTLDGVTLANLSVPAAALAAGVSTSNLGITTVVSALPVTPIDGQLCVFQNTGMATNGEKWLLQYRDGGATGKKWEFIGGPPLYGEILTVENTTSGTYVDLATSGPAIALPLAGDYMVEQGFKGGNTSGSTSVMMSYAIGGTAAVDADMVHQDVTYSGARSSAVRVRRKTGLTAVTLTSKYRTGGGTGGFENRWMRVIPVRVG